MARLAARLASSHEPNAAAVPSRLSTAQEMASKHAESSRVPVPLTAELMQQYKPAKVFKDAVHGSNQITALAFDDVGDRCVTAGEDDMFCLWDCRKGKKLKTFYSKKYGISHPRFTHRANNLIHASTKEDDAIRYHSMHENRYISYFKAHTARVRSLEVHPQDDGFLSAGDDATVRLWDLRSPACRGLLKDIGGSTLAAFDTGGMVFAVACGEIGAIMLYDLSTFDVGPFAHAYVRDPLLLRISSPPPKLIYTSLSFSNNGKYILLGTSSDVHYVFDSFNLELVRRLEGHVGLERDREGRKGVEPRRGASGEEVSWSGDSNWVLSGSNDGKVVIWDLTVPPGEQGLTLPPVPPGHDPSQPRAAPTLKPIATLDPGPSGPCRAAKFNPRLAMLATAGDELVFWLPEKEDKDDDEFMP